MSLPTSRSGVPPETVAAARASYQRCCRAPEFFACFYRNFFRACPQAEPLFARTDFQRQHKLLQHAIGLLLSFSGAPAAEPALLNRVTVEETPPPPRLVDPRPEIERALDAYRRAIESRDLAQLRAAYPGMSADQERAWRVFFGNVTELSAALKMQDLQVSGDRAQANVAGTYDFRSRTRQTQHVAFLAAFERGAAGWRLMTIK